MKWAKILLFSSLMVLANCLIGQGFSDDHAEFGKQATEHIRAHANTEAVYQVSNKFSSAWGRFSAAQKDMIIKVVHLMERRGQSKSTYFNYFAALAYAVSAESLSPPELTKLIQVSEQVVTNRTRPEVAEFAHGLNFFLAGRYLAFTRNIKTQALEGSYEFTIINGDPMAMIAGDGSVVKLDSIAAGDGLAEYRVDENEEYVDPWAEDPYAEVEIEGDPWADQEQDDPWGDSNANDDPWADDPWGDNENNDPYGENANYDPWADNANANDIYNKPKKAIPDRPKVDPPIQHDYVADMRAQYFFPPLDGPSIELKGINVFMQSHYDTMTVAGVDGNFLLTTRTFAGTGGKMNWPQVHDKMDGARVEFGDWHFEADHDYFWTPNAKLYFAKFSDEAIEGRFEFKSQAHQVGKGTDFPVFTSNYADISVELTDRAKYTGGLEVRGQKFFGKATSREKGTLEVQGSGGGSIVVTAREFVLADSSMTTRDGELKLIHGSDTIFHPSVQMWFDEAEENLTILRTKNGRMTPFRSTYFGMEINADLLKWNLADDSLTFNVLNGKQEIPLTIESDRYFTPDRFKKMNPSFPMHPLVMIMAFAKKYGDLREFYDAELVAEYKTSLQIVRANIKILEQYGMVSYDPEKAVVKVHDKAYHYFDAAAKEEDYDWMYLESYVAEGANAVMLLDSGQLIVNGVSSFSLVEGYDLEVEPDSSKQVTLLQNRSFRVDGTITEGDFVYNGKNFEFNYDQFLIDMPEIDSIRIKVPDLDSAALADSTFVADPEMPVQKKELSNNIVDTSGTLYIEEPHHKAGHEENDAYPYFVSNSDALFYFDGKEILGGAYDRSVFFVAPPFEVDSIDREAGNSFEFVGKFNSGGIFPEFEETLVVQPDQSLGFVHQIPAEGYNLYGTEARTYEKIRLNNQGIRGGGQIDFLTTQIFSDDFIYYPDSVSADGSGGRIQPGDYKGASFPEAVLGAYDMYWLPRKDSMYLRTVNEPFKFYDATAELEGFANITTNGVYGGGTMMTRGSRAISNELNFKELTYSARHAEFEILTNDPDKPAMAGDDISLEFDLVNNTATIRPEVRGVAAFSFPYAKMKTSITEAEWDLEDSVIVMTKPPAIPIEDSYFYSTREDLDSLVFSGEKATYDINTYQLKVEGIPYIQVADSRIIPEGNTTTILADSRLREFKNARVIIDTLNGFHHLNKGQITVVSRNLFQGSAFYEVRVESDTFEIRFDSFELQNVPIGPKETRRMTVSGGVVPESQNLKIAPGFFYKGSVQMFAYKQALELEGHVRMDVQNIPNGDLWIPYTRKDSSIHPHIPIQNAIFEDGSQGIAGIHNDAKGDLYSTFIEKHKTAGDLDFFRATGELSFDPESRNYKVETPGKSAEGNYAGSTLMYNDSNSNLLVEGPATFFKPTTTDIEVKAAVTGTGNRVTNEFALDCFITLNFDVTDAIIDDMGRDIISAIEIMGASTANDPTDELLYKLANLIGNRDATRYRDNMLDDYRSLLSASKELDKSVAVSGVNMKWNAEYKAWHSTSKIGLSHAGRSDINAQLDGFMEFRRDETNADVMNLFIQASPEVWYFISYHDKNLLMYSSNSDFNTLVESKSNLGKEKPGDLVFVVGEISETLGFINTFRKNYYGIETPYDLSSPSDASLEDEKFETIEDDDDDGFGF